MSMPPPSRPRGRGRTVWVALVVAALTAGGTYVLADHFQGDLEPVSIDSGTQTGLAQVTKGTLSAQAVQNGTLGYAGSYDVVNRSEGTFTRVPAVGDVIKQGNVLYKVNGQAVVLLRGDYVSVYRALAWGKEGADVQQLNSALVKLGYAGKSKLSPGSDHFGRQTYDAVKKLQHANHLKENGQVPLGQVLFLPASTVRVTSVTAIRGATAPPGSVVMKVSSTDRQVKVQLNASQQTVVKAGDRVGISLPTGRTTPGRVQSVGKVATVDSNSNTTIDVLITPLKPAVTGSLDQAPVQVSITSDTVKNVLSVPVNALLALAGGGYAVEVVDAGGARRLVGVKTGLFDDGAGKVQVTGAGLAEGQNVVVPAS